MRGGKRPGAGRRPGSMSAAKTRLQQTAKDVAAQVLSEVDSVAIWKKLILQQDKPQVVASVMEYLTDRVYGRPQQMIGGNGTPVKIELQWTGSPEWLQPQQVTVNQQINQLSTPAVDQIVKALLDPDDPKPMS
jgi:hypothetical protein